jgi:hypothetical protein
VLEPQATLSRVLPWHAEGIEVVPSGSSKRKRKRQANVRFDPSEWDEALAKADALGLSLPAALRHALSVFVISDPPPEAPKPITGKMLPTLLGHCGKLGSNATQIHRVLTARGQPVSQKLIEAVAAYPLIRRCINDAIAGIIVPPSGYRDIIPGIIAQCIHAGTDMNQLAKLSNAGREANLDHIEYVIDGYLKIRDGILAALGTTLPEALADDHQG